MKVVRVILILVALVLVVAGAGATYVYTQYQAFLAAKPSSDETLVPFVVKKGEAFRGVAERLRAEGFVGDARMFYVYARFEREDDRKVRAGEYGLSRALTPKELLDALVEGRVMTYRVTVPEGLALHEVLPLFREHGIVDVGRLQALARDREFVRSLGVPAETLEGYFFPDTYTLTRDTREEELLKAAVAATRKAMTPERVAAAKGLGLNEHQLVTLASIIEKETGAAHERPVISAVFHNRLAKKMLLQTDPTVIYAHYKRTGEWLDNIRKSHLTAEHPYNTYTTAGLPPGPIANAGDAAIDAAAHPAKSDALFFVSRNDGTHVFCPTLACHEAAVQKWQVEFFAKRRRAGAGASESKP